MQYAHTLYMLSTWFSVYSFISSTIGFIKISDLIHDVYQPVLGKKFIDTKFLCYDPPAIREEYTAHAYNVTSLPEFYHQASSIPPLATEFDKFTLRRSWTDNKCCGCNKHCLYYGTCCIDFLLGDFNGKLEEYLHYFLQRTSVWRDVAIVPILNIELLNPTHEIAHRYMIVRCRNFNSSYSEICNDIYNESDVPVYDENGRIYRNLACGKCHNETGTFNFVTISITQCIRQDENITSLSSYPIANRSGCVFDMKFQNFNRVTLSSKKSEVLTEKNEMACSERDKLLCQNYLAIIIDEEFNIWANPSCEKCYMQGPLMYNPRVDCHQFYEELAKENLAPGPFAFSLMVSHSFESTDRKINRNLCEKGEVFNVMKGTCVNFHCPQGTFKKNGECLQESKQTKVEIIDSYPTWENCFDQLGGSIIHEVPNVGLVMKDIVSKSNASEIYSTGNSSFFLWNKDKGNNITLLQDRVKEFETTATYHTLLKSLPITQHFNFSVQHHFGDGNICRHPRVTQTFNLTSQCNIIVNGTEYKTLYNATFWVTRKKNKLHFYASICNDTNFFLTSNCLTDFYNSSSYIMANTEDILVLGDDNFNKTFSPKDYIPVKGGIRACLDNGRAYTNPCLDNIMVPFKKFEYTFESKVWDVEGIISKVILVISVICEFLFIITYLSIKSLQNTPGKILITLTVVLLINDLIVFVTSCGQLEEDYCIVIGPIFHYFAISLHVWTNLLAFDLWNTLRRTFERRRQQEHDFLKYFGMASLVSTSLVGISLILEFGKYWPVNYGLILESMCWIKCRNARLALYLIPTYVLFLINMIFLLYIIYKVKHTGTPTVSTQTQTNFTTMALKLCLSFGVVEIFAVIDFERSSSARAVVLHVITMLHSIIRSARGIILFIIFFLTKKVIKHFRKHDTISKTTRTEESHL